MLYLAMQVEHHVTHNVTMRWDEHNATVDQAKHVMRGLFISDPTITTVLPNGAVRKGRDERSRRVVVAGVVCVCVCACVCVWLEWW